jgi:hypothetical protein
MSASAVAHTHLIQLLDRIRHRLQERDGLLECMRVLDETLINHLGLRFRRGDLLAILGAISLIIPVLDDIVYVPDARIGQTKLRARSKQSELP